MTQEAKKTIACHQCKTNECLNRYPEGIPDYCQIQKFPGLIEESIEQFFKPEVASIHLATAKVLKKGGYEWSRIQQCIEFAKELGVTKVGLAVCVGLIREGKEFARFLSRAGLEVTTVACMIGAVEAQQTGIPDEWVTSGGMSCNPVAQAEIMNQKGTQLNFIYGLCVGHDTLFMMYSRAPSTYIVAKDNVTVNNPSAVLFSSIHRMKLVEAYGRG